MPRSKPPTLGSKSKDAKVEFSHHRVERVYLKLLLWGLVGIILLVAFFWGGHSAYVRWQERRLVRRALTALSNGDAQDASLAARTVLELKPSSAPAVRIMAQLSEQAGNRIALDWRRKAAQLNPNSVEDALAWARCALQFNDKATAERVLSGINEEGRQMAGYHAVAGLLAQARQQFEKADAEWAEAARLAPNEKAYQLQLAILRIHSRDANQRASGESMLRALRDDPKQRAAATRALISDSLARQDGQQILELARELQAYPEATFTDRLMFLDFLHQLQQEQFTSYLTDLEKNIAANHLELAALLSWMSQNNLNLLALDLVKTVTPADLEKWPLPMAVADIYARLKDWNKLEAATKKANWRQFDFLRHAYLARALRAEDKPVEAEREWNAATKGASGQSEALLALIRSISEWKWDSETVDLLWALAKYPEKQNEALQTLYRFYARTGDTPGLYRALLRLFELDSNNPNVENNLAQVSLLLNANPDQGRRLAADVYNKAPSNAAYAATYAYSLLTKGDPKGAVKIMGTLNDEQLRDPAISAYYGICLAATGDERAHGYLDAGRGAAFLPEEKALIEKAVGNLDSRPKGN
jgi:hypothetical protein